MTTHGYLSSCAGGFWYKSKTFIEELIITADSDQIETYNSSMINNPMDPTDGSETWVEQLYHHVTQHVQTEQGLLENYISAAHGTESKALNYLVNLIIEDEKRHHRLFSELAASLKHGLDWTIDGPEIPSMDFYKVDSGKMKEVTESLLANEIQDARDLEHLHKMVKTSKDVTLWNLIVDIMQRDTEKHIAILRFVRQHID